MLRLEEESKSNSSFKLLFLPLFSNTIFFPSPEKKSMVGTSLETSKHHHLKPSSSAATTVKFLCSYGGKIAPRYPDGQLRYQGGETRVLAVDRSISFSELLLKLGELCGARVSLRCQLPKEDLDALVSITSDEDLANLMEEYDRAATPKIRAFLSMPKKISISPSSPSSSSSSLSSSPTNSYAPTIGLAAPPSTPRCYHQISKPVDDEIVLDKD
ncbi:RAF-like serine/threonine-protein kinase PRAF isoform X2 [Euphorbia lathyris]|uniref:RAF-like serine/threonine-protein kinase PRAF isoform X2 n=1 Tax=Euphorbia lathyris TaxID=212925 RepID=UPI0033140CE4